MRLEFSLDVQLVVTMMRKTAQLKGVQELQNMRRLSGFLKVGASEISSIDLLDLLMGRA